MLNSDRELLDEQIFSYATWKTPFIIIPSLILIISAVLFLSIAISAKKVEFAYIGLAVLSFLLLLYLFGFAAKIKLSPRGIEYSSWFKNVFMEWKEIKSIGGYISEKSGAESLPISKLKKFSIWGQRFIYLSTEENFYLNYGQKVNKTFIDFHYRPELLGLIEEYLRKNSNSLANEIKQAIST